MDAARRRPTEADDRRGRSGAAARLDQCPSRTCARDSPWHVSDSVDVSRADPHRPREGHRRQLQLRTARGRRPRRRPDRRAHRDASKTGRSARVDVLHRTYVWDDRSVETRTRFEQRAGESFVRVRLELDNTCDDQRVRVHVPLLEPAESSHAEGQFARGRAQSRGGRRPRRGRRPDVSGLRFRRRGRDRASPRPRHRVRGRRRRARADRAPLDRLHQPQREPVARRAGRPRDPDSGGTTPRPPFLLVRVLPEHRLDRRRRRGVPPSFLDRARHGGAAAELARSRARRSKATAGSS